MDRPHTATEGAAVLLGMAEHDPRALPFPVFTAPGDDHLAALARTPAEALNPVATQQLRARKWAAEGIVGTLPPVLAPMPIHAEDAPQLLTGVLATGPGGPTLDTGARHRDQARFRLVVLGNPADAPSTPAGSRALVISTLAARDTAAALDRWAARLPARPTQRVEAEAATYRAYAEEAEAAVSGSFSWADALDAPTASAAFSYVPATVRGTARAGVAN